MTEILQALINASERAALVARSCCNGTASQSLLVAEKCEGEANARFERDFKTIADVLAQESARNEIKIRCPELAEHFRGEECAEIGGVSIQLEKTPEQTAKLLSSLVPPETAKKMSEAAHNDLNVTSVDIPNGLQSLNPADLGVWIDPIDATAEFIAGVRGEADADYGLPCVTVLIGAYERSTGEPVVGVINQPFFNNGKGRILWGVSYGENKRWGGTSTCISEGKTILMSGAEKPEIIEKFKEAGWEVYSVPGAGHKLLKVALGEASAYIVSKGTTFRWDTCAPQAILKAKGGNVMSYSTHLPIAYNDPMNVDTQEYSNSGGIIAYTDPSVYEEIKIILK